MSCFCWLIVRHDVREPLLHLFALSSRTFWCSGAVSTGGRTAVSWGWGVGTSLRSPDWDTVRMRWAGPALRKVCGPTLGFLMRSRATA